MIVSEVDILQLMRPFHFRVCPLIHVLFLLMLMVFFYALLCLFVAELASELGYDELNEVTVEDMCMEVNSCWNLKMMYYF